jgi:hypothetical protein
MSDSTALFLADQIAQIPCALTTDCGTASGIMTRSQLDQSADDAGRRLMRQVVEFFGGEQNLTLVKSEQERISERYYTPDNQLVTGADTVCIIQFPDKVQFALANGGLSKTLGPNGAFGVNHGKVFDLSSERTEMLDDVKRQIINIAQHVNDPKYSFRIVGTGKVASTKGTLVDIDADGAEARWGVDVGSGRLLFAAQEFNDNLLGAGHVKQTIQYTDYNRFGGLNLPAKAASRFCASLLSRM